MTATQSSQVFTSPAYTPTSPRHGTQTKEAHLSENLFKENHSLPNVSDKTPLLNDESNGGYLKQAAEFIDRNQAKYSFFMRILGEINHGLTMAGIANEEIEQLSFFMFGGIASTTSAIQLLGIFTDWYLGKMDTHTFTQKIIPVLTSSPITFAGFSKLISASTAALAPEIFMVALGLSVVAYLYAAYKSYHSSTGNLSEKRKELIEGLLPGLVKIGMTFGTLLAGGPGNVFERINNKEAITSLQKVCAAISSSAAFAEVYLTLFKEKQD